MAPTNRKPNLHDAALGAAIRQRRLAVGLRLQTVADRCGLSLQQVHKYETGVSRVPFSRLTQLAAALGCEVGDLVRPPPGTPAEAPPAAGARRTAGEVFGAAQLLQAYAALPRRARRRVMAFVQRLAAASRSAPDVAPAADDRRSAARPVEPWP